MSRIELTNVTKRWGQFYAVDNLSMVIEDNAFVTLLGPSGCGKTTTLRMIAGLETPTSGRITIDGVPVFDSQRGINVSANKRKVGFLFQNYALWPNMTVYQNISFGLTNIKEEMDEIDFDARAAARMIEILQKPQDVVRAINECVDKKKKLNMDKAYLRLIDLYEISLFTAKALMGMKLHEAGDPKAAAAQEIKKLEEKLRKNRLTLSDYLDQLEQLQNMGDLSQIASMLPGNMAKGFDPDQIDPKQFARTKAIIQSMTLQERENPQILNASRKRRIAAGCGQQVSDVNRLLKGFETMQQMTKALTRGKRGMGALSGLMGGGGGMHGFGRKKRLK